MNFDTVVGGDIVYVNELSRKRNVSDRTQLVIQETDRTEIFYFDLPNPDKNGEYPAYRAFADIKIKYAEDFLDFLKGRITDEW
jgi:hypothetical protein